MHFENNEAMRAYLRDPATLSDKLKFAESGEVHTIGAKPPVRGTFVSYYDGNPPVKKFGFSPLLHFNITSAAAQASDADDDDETDPSEMEGISE